MTESWAEARAEKKAAQKLSAEEAKQRRHEVMLSDLKGAVNLLIRNSSVTDKPIDDHEPMLKKLCGVIERILVDGIKVKRSVLSRVKGKVPAFWGYVCHLDQLLPSAFTCISSIKNFTELSTDVQRGRAFIRFSLVEGTLGDYLAALVQQKELTMEWYEETALLSGEDDAEVLTAFLQPLKNVQFNFDMSLSELHSIFEEPYIVRLDIGTVADVEIEGSWEDVLALCDIAASPLDASRKTQRLPGITRWRKVRVLPFDGVDEAPPGEESSDSSLPEISFGGGDPTVIGKRCHRNRKKKKKMKKKKKTKTKKKKLPGSEVEALGLADGTKSVTASEVMVADVEVVTVVGRPVVVSHVKTRRILSAEIVPKDNDQEECKDPEVQQDSLELHNESTEAAPEDSAEIEERKRREAQERIAMLKKRLAETQRKLKNSPQKQKPPTSPSSDKAPRHSSVGASPAQFGSPPASPAVSPKRRPRPHSELPRGTEALAALDAKDRVAELRQQLEESRLRRKEAEAAHQRKLTPPQSPCAASKTEPPSPPRSPRGDGRRRSGALTDVEIAPTPPLRDLAAELDKLLAIIKPPCEQPHASEQPASLWRQPTRADRRGAVGRVDPSILDSVVSRAFLDGSTAASESGPASCAPYHSVQYACASALAVFPVVNCPDWSWIAGNSKEGFVEPVGTVDPRWLSGVSVSSAGLLTEAGAAREGVSVKSQMRPRKGTSSRPTSKAPPARDGSGAVHATPRNKVLMFEPPLQSIAEQDNMCYGCGKKIRSGKLKKARLCAYFQRHFCTKCHTNARKVIPARLLASWDANEYPVSTKAVEVLANIWDVPLFSVNAVNPELYSLAKPLRAVKHHRETLRLLATFLSACPTGRELRDEEFMHLQHILLEQDVLSLRDLVSTHSGELPRWLILAKEELLGHVAACSSCRGRGCVCPLCNLPDPVFPFEVNLVVECASGCGALMHRQCIRGDGVCPSCDNGAVGDARA